VGGHNYGQDIISQGILPLVFANEADYDTAEQGDEWNIEGVRQAVESGEMTLSASTGSGGEIVLEALLLTREREVLLAGGTRQVPPRRKPGSGLNDVTPRSGNGTACS